MQVEDIKKIACVGGGTIGAGWATFFLWKGFDVTVHDINNEALERARHLIESNLTFMEEKEIITEVDRQVLKDEIIYTTDYAEAFTNVDYVQESVFETYEIKQTILQELDKYAPKAIYASSSSGLLISEIQKYSQYPERCVIAHPFNPPHLIPLVEIVKGEQTSEEIVQLTYDFFIAVGKEPIILNKEIPGHAASRIQMALWRECADLVMNGVLSVKDVDIATRFGPGLRWALMGPNLTWDLSHPNGIEGTIDHIGPSMNIWLPDMAKWEAVPEEAGRIMAEGLTEVKESTTVDEIKEWRDEKLIEILKLSGKL